MAQGVGISEVSIIPDGSSILELQSTQRGFLLPRMTTAERDAIIPAATGLLIYNTDTKAFNYFNGTFWIPILHTGSGVTSVNGTSDRISVDNTDAANPVVDIARITSYNVCYTKLLRIVPTVVIVFWPVYVIAISTTGFAASVLSTLIRSAVPVTLVTVPTVGVVHAGAPAPFEVSTWPAVPAPSITVVFAAVWYGTLV